MTIERATTSVLVVGAGPVGLTLAMDLAWRGVPVTVLELRAKGEPPSVKCNHVSARSMEVFRRLGVARALRDAGLPPDYPNDVAYRTTATGIELARIPIPCRRDRYTATGGPDTWWPPPDPPRRIIWTYPEPALFARASAMPGCATSTAHASPPSPRTGAARRHRPSRRTMANGSRSPATTTWAATAPAPPRAGHRRRERW